jgi:hypothetical protein
LTASVLVAVTWPAATLVMVRCAVVLPTATVLVGAVPANPVKVTVPMAALLVAVVDWDADPWPMATSPALAAEAPTPSATELAAWAIAPVVPLPPMATAPMPRPEAPVPSAKL